MGSVLKNASEEHAAIHRHVFDVQVTHHILKGIAPRQDGYESSVLAGLSSPTSTSASAAPSATAISVCPGANGTIYTSAAGIRYLIVCDVDYPGNDYPFRLVDTFASCVQACDIYNYDNHHVPCVAALFIASRETTTNDCYLKSSIKNPTAATLQIHGAIRLEYTTNSSSTSSTTSHSSTSTLTSVLSNSTSITTSTSGKTFSTYLSTSSSSAASSVSSPAVTYASGDNVIVPKVARSRLQGPTVNTPSTQYLDIKAPASITLAKSLLTIGAKGDFSTGYNISPQTGVLEVNISTQSYLSSLTDIPHLSRDGGKGGMLNGEHLFIFCDTGSYSPPSYDVNGEFLGFVSSSVAIDTGMNGLSGHALHLKDGIGEWSDKAGRMRGFAPLTEGEQAYNLDMQGNGQRYAVWPEASIIPIDATTGIIYAPIVYDNVNMATKAAVFTYTGATLLTITVGGQGGPVAQRTVDKIFDQDEVEWGCAGGIRSWGASGVGGDDGSVYVFGNVAGGLLVGRTSPANVADVSSVSSLCPTCYTYTNLGSSLNTGMAALGTATCPLRPLRHILSKEHSWTSIFSTRLDISLSSSYTSPSTPTARSIIATLKPTKAYFRRLLQEETRLQTTSRTSLSTIGQSNRCFTKRPQVSAGNTYTPVEFIWDTTARTT